MRTIRDLGPLALGVALLCTVTWVLLDGGGAAGSWLLAGLLVAHGLIHLLFLAPQPARAATVTGPAWPFDLGGSWLVVRGTDPSVVRTTGGVLLALTVACSVLGALAIVGVLIPGGWWSGLVVGAALASLGLLAIAFSSMLLVGVAIDLALVWLAVASGWAPGT